MFKKYKWFDVKLEKKYSRYNYYMLGAMALSLILLYALPQTVKAICIITLVIGLYMWYMGYRTQSQDRNLRKQASVVKVQTAK